MTSRVEIKCLPEAPHQPVCACMLSHVSHVQLFAALQIVAHQSPLSIGFSRQEYWSGLPCPSPGHLAEPGIKPESPAFQAVFLSSEPPGSPQETFVYSQVWRIQVQDQGISMFLFSEVFLPGLHLAVFLVFYHMTFPLCACVSTVSFVSPSLFFL